MLTASLSNQDVCVFFFFRTHTHSSHTPCPNEFRVGGQPGCVWIGCTPKWNQTASERCVPTNLGLGDNQDMFALDVLQNGIKQHLKDVQGMHDVFPS